MTATMQTTACEAPGDAKRSPYHRPELQFFGDVRGLTLGGSPGMGDSGGDINVEQSSSLLLGYEDLP